MNIGEASDQSNLPPKTIRYYEDIHLVTPARAENGYRDYSAVDVHQLQFVQRARSLGFTVKECRQLLALYGNKRRASSDVKKIVGEKVDEIDRKLKELKSLKRTLVDLMLHCRGDSRPECPILDDLSS